MPEIKNLDLDTLLFVRENLSDPQSVRVVDAIIEVRYHTIDTIPDNERLANVLAGQP